MPKARAIRRNYTPAKLSRGYATISGWIAGQLKLSEPLPSTRSSQAQKSPYRYSPRCEEFQRAYLPPALTPAAHVSKMGCFVDGRRNHSRLQGSPSISKAASCRTA